MSHSKPVVELPENETCRLMALLGTDADSGARSAETGAPWLNPALVDALVPYVERLAGHKLRFSRKGTAPFRSPYRNDRRASAFFSLKTGCIHDSLYAGKKDFQEGRAAGVVKTCLDLCADAGIDPRDYGGLRDPNLRTRTRTRILPTHASIHANSPDGGSNASNFLHGDTKLERSAALSQGRLLAVRLLDLLGKHSKLTDIRRADVLACGLSLQQAKDALSQALVFGALVRTARGVYAVTPAGLDYLASTPPLPDRAYAGHSMNYRQEAYREAVKDTQPTQPTRRHPSISRIARKAGVSLSTAYRYEKMGSLGIERHPLWWRRELSGAVAEFGALLNYKTLWYVELFDPQKTHEDLPRIYPGRGAWGEADTSAVLLQVAQMRQTRPKMRAWAVWRVPSIRLLPGQDIRDHIPPGGRLLPDGTVIVTIGRPGLEVN